MKRRVITKRRKAEIIMEFDSLPQGRGRSNGGRVAFRKKHRISWSGMNAWRNDPDVQEVLYMLQSKNGAKPEPKSELTARQLIDMLEIEHESLGEVIRRMKTHVE